MPLIQFVASLLIVMRLYWCYFLTHYGEPLWSSFCSFSTLSSTLGALLTAVGFIRPLVILPCTWVFRHYLLLVQPSRCSLLVSPGSSHSGIAFCHRFRMPLSEHALSLSLPRSFWDAVPIVLPPTSDFMRFLFLTGGLLLDELSLSFACFSWCLVPRSLSFQLSAVCRGSIFLLHGFLLPLGYSSISLMSFLLTSVWSFPISTASFSVDCRLRSFSAPTFPRVYSSVPMRCSFLHCYFGWLAIFPIPLFLWMSMVHLPLPIPHVRHFPLYSLGALLPPVPSVTGSSLWAESVPYWGFSTLYLFVLRISFGVCASVSSYSSSLVPFGFFSRVARLFFVHVLLLSYTSLV